MFQVTTVLPEPHEPISKIPFVGMAEEEKKEEKKKGKKEKKDKKKAKGEEQKQAENGQPAE